MEMIKKEKTFDAVKTMREIRDKVSSETQNMTFATLKAYLKKMRSTSASAPSLEEITKIVEDVRAKRYGKKKDGVDSLSSIYPSPDIDFTKIKTNKKGVKILLFVLNSFKFPAPGLEYSNGKLRGRWLVF